MQSIREKSADIGSQHMVQFYSHLWARCFLMENDGSMLYRCRMSIADALYLKLAEYVRHQSFNVR